MKKASRPEDQLMLGVAKNLEKSLVDTGKAAVREIVTQASRLGVSGQELPYVFWALAQKANLPSLGRNEESFSLMIEVMEKTGTMPPYQSGFQVPESFSTDSAVDALARFLAVWSKRVMFPLLLQDYKAALQSQVRAVPKLTQGRVRPEDAFDFLRGAFRQLLSLQSAMFQHGELLRRVVRVLPV